MRGEGFDSKRVDCILAYHGITIFHYDDQNSKWLRAYIWKIKYSYIQGSSFIRQKQKEKGQWKVGFTS